MISEATYNILIYELDVLYIFDISIVCPYMRYANLFEFWFDITHCECLILLNQLRAMKIGIVLFLSILPLRESG